MLNKLRSPSFTTKNPNQVKQKQQNPGYVNAPLIEHGRSEKQHPTNDFEADYNFLASDFIQNDQKHMSNHKPGQKNAKSHDKQATKQLHKPVLQQKYRQQKPQSGSNHRGCAYDSSSSAKVGQHSSLLKSSKYRNPVLKENFYSPSAKEKHFNQTVVSAGTGGFASQGGLKQSFHNITTLDEPSTEDGLSQTQQREIDFGSSGGVRGNLANRWSQGFNKNATLRTDERMKDKQQKGTEGNCGGTKVLNNSYLQEFMTNISKPHIKQASSSNNPSTKRQPSNTNSNNQIIPSNVDSRRVSAKQIQNMMKQQELASRRENSDNHGQGFQNQLSNIADSALYKNLTQKLIQEQQQQYASNTTMNSQKNLHAQPQPKHKKVTPKYNGGPVNFHMNFRNSKANSQKQQIPTTTMNKTQKFFNFDLSNRKSNAVANSGTKNEKKKLNLTGTLPKGSSLLSPTNQGTNKHKHSEYFQSVTNAQAATTRDNSQKSHPSAGRKIPKNSSRKNVKNEQNANSTSGSNKLNVDCLLYQSQIDHFNQMIINIENSGCHHYQQPPYPQQQNNFFYGSSIPQHWQFQQTQAPTFNQGDKKNRLNQTTKIQRVDSMSPSELLDYSSQQYKCKEQNQYKEFSQPVSTKHGKQQKRPTHQKTATVPNAEILRKMAAMADNHPDSVAKEGKTPPEDQKQHGVTKVQSVGQTPRVEKQVKNLSQINGRQKQDNITIRKKKLPQQQVKKNLQLQLSDDEHCGDDVQQIQENQIEFDENFPIVMGTHNSKIRTQKFDDFKHMLNNNEEKSNVKSSFNATGKAQLHFSPNSDVTSPANEKKKSQIKHSQQRRNKHSQQLSSGSSSRKSPISLKKSQDNFENVTFPITAPKAIKLFISHLTDYEKGEILDYKHIYYLGIGAKKIKASPLQIHNQGYDDERGDYKVVLKDHIGYRWEVLEFLGKGSFGQALKCFDHKTKEVVAVKLIRNKKKFQHQAGVELKILQHLKECDPEDQYNIIRIKDHLIYRKHLVISFELFSINLYEFIKNNNFQGVSLSLIRRFAIQLLQGLKFLREENVIHCDLKPENVLLKSPEKSGIKIIDFGSSCFQDERIYTYIQSRFYRAPEIMLGIPYTPAIDMWSLGCILVELFTGYPIFPGESEQEQLALIMEVRGLPPEKVLTESTRKGLFFEECTDEPILVENSRGKVRVPSTKSLEGILRCSSESFLNFIDRCLDWNPRTRITPVQALMHDWIIEGLPPKVLEHHQRILGLCDSEEREHESLPKNYIIFHKSQAPPVKNHQGPHSTKAFHQARLNKTCLLSQEGAEGDSDSILKYKKGKSLNRTGMVIIDENEDMTGMEKFPFVKKPVHHRVIDEEEDEEKGKTPNITDLVYRMQSGGSKKQEPQKMFENTHDISKLKKSSFFSNNHIEECEAAEIEDEEGAVFLPFDEREQQHEVGSKKNRAVPFSFLMHHYMKTNGGKQVATQHSNIGQFYKPEAMAGAKLINNYMGGHQKKKTEGKLVNLSSNV